jgi:hypothetical protein
MSYGGNHMKSKQTCKAKSLRIVSSIMLLNALFLAHGAHAAMIAKCNQYDTVNITKATNTYKVHNNVQYSINNSQCIRVDDATGNFSVITSATNFPITGVPASFAFIAKGCHWGACTNPAQSGMPKKISALLNASSSWKTTQPTIGAYDVSYNIWFNTTTTTNTQPNGAEIMIWLANKGGVKPIGLKEPSNVTIAGSTWAVWKGLNNGINIITYVRTTNVTSVSNLNLKAFITDATTRNVIQTSWYLIAVEAGFEIWQSSGGLASSNFSVLVE